jgi:hypothetical protein
MAHTTVKCVSPCEQCQIIHPHSGDYEPHQLLGWGASFRGGSPPTFRMDISMPSRLMNKGSEKHAISRFVRLLLQPSTWMLYVLPKRRWTSNRTLKNEEHRNDYTSQRFQKGNTRKAKRNFLLGGFSLIVFVVLWTDRSELNPHKLGDNYNYKVRFYCFVSRG